MEILSIKISGCSALFNKQLAMFSPGDSGRFREGEVAFQMEIKCTDAKKQRLINHKTRN